MLPGVLPQDFVINLWGKKRFYGAGVGIVFAKARASQLPASFTKFFIYLESLEKEKSSSRDTPESGVSRFGIPFWEILREACVLTYLI